MCSEQQITFELVPAFSQTSDEPNDSICIMLTFAFCAGVCEKKRYCNVGTEFFFKFLFCTVSDNVMFLLQMYARHADFLGACVGQGFEMVSLLAFHCRQLSASFRAL